MRSKENPLEKKSSEKSGSSGKLIFKEKAKKNMKMKPRTKFEEFLELDMNKGIAGAEEDLEMERRLAKKLKVKGGKLRGDDGISELFVGIPSLLDPMSKGTIDDDDIEDEGDNDDGDDDDDDDDDDGNAAAINDNVDDEIMEPISSSKNLKRNKSSRLSAEGSEDETAATTDRDTKLISSRKKRKKRSSLQSSREYSEDGSVDAQLEREEEMHNAASKGPDTLNEESHVKALKMDVSMKYVAPRLRANSNKESVELSQIRRRVRGLFNRLSESNVESITDEVASIFRSLSRSVGCEIIGDEVIASCSRGPRGNEQYAAVFAAFVAGMACIVGIDFSAKLIASIAKSFEDEYSKEDGLSLRNLTLLLSYIYVFGVCSSDLIYDFLSLLSKRLTEMDVSTILTVLQCCGMKLRGDDPTAMKDFVLNIQNRASEAKSQSGHDGKPKLNSKRMEFMLETIFDIKNNKKRPKEEPTNQTRIKKWLQKLRAEDIQLRSLRWNKLLDPQKKGQWWLSGEIASTMDNVEEVATTINTEVLEAQKLLQLAAAQRMNTDVRRAIFCIIMSGEDYIDAFEKILRLDLSGKQDREIMRVLVECCLQEKVFNKYYTVLASKLCSHEKNHKFTLQYCIWDHYKELDSMELYRSMNLAGFVAEMLSTFSLSLALLKTAELMDPAQLTPRRIMHFRMLFEAVFNNSDALVWNIFTRVASAPELEMLRSGLVFFIKQYVVAANPRTEFAGKYRIAKKALQNVAGVLM